MANDEHLRILRQGVEVWNTWREENPDIRPDLRAADLGRADLRYADLGGAHLEKADLWGADLGKAHLGGAHLGGAHTGYTRFGDVDLSTVLGLDTVVHLGPSSIDIDTIYRSEGNIPESFLEGAGVPDSFIRYMRSLTGPAITFDSCFISYSEKDRPFAERLYADLRQKEVRCWFAPEDIKTGDEFRTRIDEAIHLQDRLLVILSKHSIKSSWVQDEVEAALEKEKKEKRLVLFPIRLDEAVMGVDAGWAAKIRRTRQIGDFKKWKNHDTYQQAFDRLLRDLTDEKP